MSSDKNKNLSKLENVLYFPNKVSSKFLMLIIILALVISWVIIAFVIPQRKYQNIPNYKEVQYANDNYNPYLRIYSNYSLNSEEKLVKKDTISLLHYTFPSGYTASDISTYATGISKDGTQYFLSPTARMSGSVSSSTGTLASSKEISGGGLKTFYAQLVYKINHPTEGISEEKFKNFREDILTLTKQEINSDIRNDFEENKKIFATFTLRITTATSNDKLYSISNSFMLTTDAVSTSSAESISKFHLDYQLFAIDKDGDFHELLGYYGVSNNRSRSYSPTSFNFPKDYKIEYIIAKAEFTNVDGKLTTYIYKQPFNTLIY